MLESELLAKVTKLAKIHGWLCYHTHNSRGSEPGFPDLVMCKVGRVIFAELKTEHGHLSGKQRGWMLQLMAGDPATRSFEVYVWRPSDLDRIEEVLGGGSCLPSSRSRKKPDRQGGQ